MTSAKPDPTTLDQSFEFDNATHHYHIKWCSLGNSNNPPLVFVHGTPWSSRVWKPFALALSRQYHVYLFDNPGFGESPLEVQLHGNSFQEDSEVTRLDADLARQSEVFAALYKSWSKDWAGRKAHVVAHDHAGLMSLRAYLLHDCEFASLCLIDVVAIGPFGQSLFKSIADNPQVFQDLPDMAFDGILESYIRNAAFKDLSPHVMEMLKAPWVKEGGKSGFIRQLCQANSRSTEEVEGRYGVVGEQIPVKVIWGTQDKWIPVETASRLGHALKAKIVVQIEDAGHLIMYDEPVALAVELTGWLDSVAPTTPRVRR
ncbi:hypothetical protein ACEQ8H_005993 [Pleosporales sp. CAS-2024a]